MSSNKCPKCGKTVYMPEKAAGKVGGDAPWHKNCFRCQSCDKKLSGGSYSEHAGMPYCDMCHKKHHGIKGYGFGNNLDSHAPNAAQRGELKKPASKPPAPRPAAAAAPAPRPAAAGGGGAKFCSSCGARRVGDAKFCSEDGTKF